MKIKITLILIVFGFLLGCERQAELKVLNSFSERGVSFKYPKNWNIDSDDIAGNTRTIIVSSSWAGIFIIQIQPRKQAPPLRAYAERFYEKGKIDSFESSERNKSKGYKGNFKEQYLGISDPHQIEFYSLKTKNSVVFMVSQISVQDFPKVSKGFNLIHETFKYQ